MYYYDTLKKDVYNSYDGQPITDYFKQEQILSINEYRSQSKSIVGYRCFKVAYTYKEQSEEYAGFMPSITYTRTLWVTESIRSPFHSVVNRKEILSKYYPLEITEEVLGVRGFVTKYTTDLIDLK